jgi:FtsX extracellular domain
VRRLVALLVVVLTAACSGTPSTATHRSAPDLAGFLRQPAATPTTCPSGVTGSASGRRSPWVGHVDVSVFVATTARPAAVKDLGDRLRRTPSVAQVYFETAAQAFAEYARLYTCSAQVPRSAVPASYRLVLDTISHSQRDALVREIVRMPEVQDVSCDPSDPCTNASSKSK